MALDLNGIKFLLWARNLGVSFERTLTLGHQGLSCSRRALGRALRDFGVSASDKEVDRCFDRPTFAALYADQFLRLLGAKEIVSADRSDFEEANLVHDLNHPFPTDLRGSFDMVIDGGTLEHIFNYPAALSHCLDLLRVGGHFVSITPGTGQMGHGFYQFSPELFFRVFSSERGYSLRKIVAYKSATIDAAFYEVTDPAISAQRTAAVGNKPLQLAVLAAKVADVVPVSEPPQQSDYAAIWERHQVQQGNPSQRVSAGDSALRRLRFALNPYWPLWLRDLRDSLRHRQSWALAFLRSSLVNRRHFRRLPNRKIFAERFVCSIRPTSDDSSTQTVKL